MGKSLTTLYHCTPYRVPRTLNPCTALWFLHGDGFSLAI